MNTDILKNITTIVFLIVIGIYTLLSLFAAYVFIRYGRTRGIAVLTSLVFGGVFVLGTLAAYATLLQIF